MQIKQVIFMYLGVYVNTYMYETNLMKQSINESETEQGGIYLRIWRKERKEII